MEVEPEQPREKNCFLHLLTVGDTSLTEAPELDLLERQGEQGKESGVEFNYQGRDYLVLFRQAGLPGGYIKISDSNGVILCDQSLADKVQPQSGIGSPGL